MRTNSQINLDIIKVWLPRSEEPS